jgi:hypothetical protein
MESSKGIEVAQMKKIMKHLVIPTSQNKVIVVTSIPMRKRRKVSPLKKKKKRRIKL